MSLFSIAYLGPAGTYAEVAALTWGKILQQTAQAETVLVPCPSIAKALKACQTGKTDFVVVPVENSTEGSVTQTLDTLWQLDGLRIQQALTLPISHALISLAHELAAIETVYSHPQALAQCQLWLEKQLPDVKLIPVNSTAEALQRLAGNTTTAAIASQRSAQMYNLPILAHPINDNPDNCTRFWVLSLQPSPGGNHTSLAFSVPANVPGALVKPLQVLADRGINLSRIESRPTKRSLGDYLFFIDIEAGTDQPNVEMALQEIQQYTETLKTFGSYEILSVTERL